MKVLVTGADGFIGSHLVEKLIQNDYKVKAFCIYNSYGSKGWLDTLPAKIIEKIDFFLGDIRDTNCVKEAMKDCTHVFHLAALIAIPYSYIAPASYIDTNVHGTLNILQAAKDLNIKQVIHTSTSETYGTAQFVPINESHPLVGQSPYSASKIAADQIATSFWKSFNTPVTILRPFNTYGPRQSNRAVIPTIITQIASGKKEIKLGKISPTRDFNFVSDTCSAFVKLLNNEIVIGKIINSASNFEISIEETALLIAKIMNVEITIKSEENRLRPKNSEVERLFGDNSLLKKLTNWEPEFGDLNGFEKGLRITIDWFTDPSNLERYNSKNSYQI
ncbi:NAD-dependent dehydratase [bacterium]|nr:NAD-dependent dehydratase [bacterium]